MKADEIILHDRSGTPLVALSSDDAANGQRLKVRSFAAESTSYIDALMLESLTWARAAELSGTAETGDLS